VDVVGVEERESALDERGHGRGFLVAVNLGAGQAGVGSSDLEALSK
jgi:hypothetical protein